MEPDVGGRGHDTFHTPEPSESTGRGAVDVLWDPRRELLQANGPTYLDCGQNVTSWAVEGDYGLVERERDLNKFSIITGFDLAFEADDRRYVSLWDQFDLGCIGQCRGQ